MAAAAYEQITSRLALPASELLEKYLGAQIAADGTLEKSDGSRPFAGVVQYGNTAVGDFATVVQGIFPVTVSADVTKGTRLKPDSTAGKEGKFVAALNTDDAVGVALQDIDSDAGVTGSMLMVYTKGAAA